MSRAAAVRSADIDRAIKCLIKNGLTVASVIVRSGGEVVITPGPAPGLTPAAPPAQADSLDARRAMRAAREAQRS